AMRDGNPERDEEEAQNHWRGEFALHPEADRRISEQQLAHANSEQEVAAASSESRRRDNPDYGKLSPERTIWKNLPDDTPNERLTKWLIRQAIIVALVAF